MNKKKNKYEVIMSFTTFIKWVIMVFVIGIAVSLGFRLTKFILPDDPFIMRHEYTIENEVNDVWYK